QANTPFTTITPYALEAAHRCWARFGDLIRGAGEFFDKHVVVMEEDATTMATSYGPFRDRIVTNAVSYTMYSQAVLNHHLPSPSRIIRIGKLFGFIRRDQKADGSWLYSPQGSSFIDCFHSCIVLKNLIKTSRLVDLDGIGDVVANGWKYIATSFLDRDS